MRQFQGANGASEIAPCKPGNPFLAFEHMMSDMIASGLEMWATREMRRRGFFFNPTLSDSGALFGCAPTIPL